MTNRIGTEARPLRVAIIGAGPSGFYAAQALLEQSQYQVLVDVFDHLPAPYGLVRYGVAPDHQKIKAVTRVYDRIAEDPRFRFFGNVTFGQDITHDEVLRHFDMVIYAVGAQSDRRLNIPGEDLERSLPATHFVAWYNGHPDYAHLQFDLGIDKVAVIGVGNVAMDVARILALSPDELARTDIADYALEALRHSRVRDIYIIARRGPAQAKFTNPELRELAELEVTDIIIDPRELELDPYSEAAIADNREAQTNLEIMRHYAQIGETGKPKRIHFLFLRSPVELIGDEQGRVVRMKLEKNILKPTETGYLAAHGTGEYEWLDVGMVVRAIGYRGHPLPGVPFNPRWGVISNQDGRVTDHETGEIVPREYVVGWAKRGATGVIGTNKPDAAATVRLMLEDVPHITPAADEDADPEAIVRLLESRNIRYVSWQDWKLIDAAEVEEGRRQGRPRVKFTSVEAMFQALRRAIEALTRDILIIGGGPAGLYAAFYAGYRKLRAKVLEALPLVGGKMATLYPQTDITDLPGFMSLNAAEFVRRLRDQATQFGEDVEILVNRRVRSITRDEDVFLVKDQRGETHRGRRIILASGQGAMRPNRMDNPSVRRLEGRGVYYCMRDRAALRGKRVLIVGGGDTAVLWALNLQGWADQVTLIHRREEFRAAPSHVAALFASQVDVRLNHVLEEVKGKRRAEAAVIRNVSTGETTELPVDTVLLALGFHIDARLLERLGLNQRQGRAVVDGAMRTSEPGIYAVGDAAIPADADHVDLIITGLGEAATAVNQIAHELDPEQPLTPRWDELAP